jgi:hypothetical protein
MRRPGPFTKAHTCVLFVLKVGRVGAAWSWLTVCLLTSILFFSSTPASRAQTLSGIQGTVTDQTGLPIANAVVTIANTDTGVRRNTTTGTLGSYHLTDLIPGTYTVTVEKQGFKSSIQKNVFVQAAVNSTANIVLTVGDARETVEVTASEISLQTEQASLGTTIQHKLLEELPQLVDGTVRQIDAHFMCLAPGVTTVSMTDGASARGVSSVGGISGGLTPGVSTDGRINGGVDFQNEVVFNGVPIAFAEFQGRQYYINPPFDMVKEFTVLQSAFSAQYGLGQGVAQYQLQSGTNKIHGNTFAVYRDAFFDAPGAVNDVNPNDRGIVGEPNTDHQIDWGFTAGGPLRIPKLYGGHDKTFWFVSIEKFRQTSAQPPVTVPTEAIANGDFSGLVVPRETSQIPIFVPIAWQADPSLMPAGCDPGAAPGKQFPGNVIPRSCFSAVSKSLLGFIPKPTSSDEINNFQSGFIPLLAHTVWGFTLDHNINSRQAIHGAYWRNQEQIAGGFVDNPLNNTTTNHWFGSGLLVTYSHAITPRLMLSGGVSWISEIFNYHQQKPIGSFAGVEPSPGGEGFLPGINFVGSPWQPVNWGTFGWLYAINRKHGLGIANNWLYARGRHTLNFGMEIRRTFQDDQECQQCAGNLSFNSRTTADPVNDPGGSVTGNGFASFLLGNVDSAVRSNTPMTRLRNFYIAPYFQDNIKITPRFALNLGLRWDLAFPFTNDNNANQLVFFDPTKPNLHAINPATGQPLLGAMSILGKDCRDCAGWNHPDMQWRHFSPRLGFVYQLNNKTVVQAGMSFTFLNTGAFEYGTNQVAVNFGNNLNGNFTLESDSQIPLLGQWDTNPLPLPSRPSPDYLFVENPSEIHRHIDQGYTELFSVGVQRELPWKMFTSISYVHSHDLHLPAALIRRNQLDPKIPALCPDGLFSELDCVIAESWTSDAGQAVLKDLGFGQFEGLYTPYDNYMNDWGDRPLVRLLVPYPQFRDIRNPFDTTGADMYDALQVSFQKRTGSGLTVLVAYTLSKSFSNTDSAVSSSNVRGLNQFNPESEWSVARDDRTHVLSISQVYELPIGPGKKILNHGGAFMKNLLGGWAFSGHFHYMSGTPVKITVNGARPTGFTTLNRANIMPGPFDVKWDNYYKGLPVFNIKKFQFPGAWRVGNAVPFYSGLRNPFESNETLGLSKRFFLGERVRAELRVEFDNVLNRMRVCGGDRMDTSPYDVAGLDPNNTNFNFGIVSPGAVCQGNTPRRGQVFFKVTF